MNETIRALPRTAVYAIRWAILERDNFACHYCGQFAPNVLLEVDHRIPVCEGGNDDPENLVTACAACNRGKEGFRAAIKGRSRQKAAKGKTIAEAIAETLQAGPLTVREIASILDMTPENVAGALRARRDDRFRNITADAGGRGKVALWELIHAGPPFSEANEPTVKSNQSD